MCLVFASARNRWKLKLVLVSRERRGLIMPGLRNITQVVLSRRLLVQLNELQGALNENSLVDVHV